jgi:ubiquinone/menaquinone biosynthesis C-methylase UbiE
VLGVDIASHLVATGNRRVVEAGLSYCRFQEGDAGDLRELEDNSFDLVVSMFGAMFVPRPFDVVKEMVRVTKAGGRIVMGNWIPNDPTLVAQILKSSSAYAPPPPDGFVSPMTWGVESHVIERSWPQARQRAASRSRETPTASSSPARLQHSSRHSGISTARP